MKTTILILGIVGAIGFSSCKKEHTCVCRDTDGDVADVTIFEDAKLGDAKEACEDKEDQMNANIFDPETYICTLD